MEEWHYRWPDFKREWGVYVIASDGESEPFGAAGIKRESWPDPFFRCTAWIIAKKPYWHRELLVKVKQLACQYGVRTVNVNGEDIPVGSTHGHKGRGSHVRVSE